MAQHLPPGRKVGGAAYPPEISGCRDLSSCLPDRNQQPAENKAFPVVTGAYNMSILGKDISPVLDLHRYMEKVKATAHLMCCVTLDLPLPSLTSPFQGELQDQMGLGLHEYIGLSF